MPQATFKLIEKTIFSDNLMLLSLLSETGKIKIKEKEHFLTKLILQPLHLLSLLSVLFKFPSTYNSNVKIVV